MSNIKNIAFDLGGVVLALSYEQAVARFEEIGLRNARQHLDAFEQKGIAANGKVVGEFRPTGAIPSWFDQLKGRGLSCDVRMFDPESHVAVDVEDGRAG